MNFSAEKTKKNKKKHEKKNLNDAWRNVRKFVTACDSTVINSSLISFWMFRWTFFGGILFHHYSIERFVDGVHSLSQYLPPKVMNVACLLFMYQVDKREHPNDFCHLLHRETCVGNKLKPNTFPIFFRKRSRGFQLRSFSFQFRQNSNNQPLNIRLCHENFIATFSCS